MIGFQLPNPSRTLRKPRRKKTLFFYRRSCRKSKICRTFPNRATALIPSCIQGRELSETYKTFVPRMDSNGNIALFRRRKKDRILPSHPVYFSSTRVAGIREICRLLWTADSADVVLATSPKNSNRVYVHLEYPWRREQGGGAEEPLLVCARP